MKPVARRRAFVSVLPQTIYSWQLSGNDIAGCGIEFLSEQDTQGRYCLFP